MAAAVITAVYKVNLHCRECASEIKKPLLRTEGVHQVVFDLEKNDVKVKGGIDVFAIHKRIERLCKRMVELISTKVAVNEAIATVVKETKEGGNTSFQKFRGINSAVHFVCDVKVATRTIQIKAFMHGDQCERDLQTKLLSHRGIFSVKTDMKAQTLTVQGTIENDKLLRYIQNKVNKRAEIKSQKVLEKTEEKIKVEKKVEVKTKEGNPYFVHYVYAPQIFSDENPNTCSVM